MFFMFFLKDQGDFRRLILEGKRRHLNDRSSEDLSLIIPLALLPTPTHPFRHPQEERFLSSFLPSMPQTRIGPFPMVPGLQKVGVELRDPQAYKVSQESRCQRQAWGVEIGLQNEFHLRDFFPLRGTLWQGSQGQTFIWYSLNPC